MFTIYNSGFIFTKYRELQLKHLFSLTPFLWSCFSRRATHTELPVGLESDPYGSQLASRHVDQYPAQPNDLLWHHSDRPHSQPILQRYWHGRFDADCVVQHAAHVHLRCRFNFGGCDVAQPVTYFAADSNAGCLHFHPGRLSELVIFVEYYTVIFIFSAVFKEGNYLVFIAVLIRC